MAYTPVAAIEVWVWGRRVGAIAQNPRTGMYAFRYDPDWVVGGVELAPFHMPLASKTYEYPGLAEETFKHLPPAIADSLPDRFGNALVDRWMAEKGVAVGEFTVLDRLAYASDRAIGALEFRPPARDARDTPPSAVQLADLVLAARAAFGAEPLDIDQGALEQLIEVGTSAGGARPKAIVAYNPATNQIQSAYRELPDGFEHWLFKLDGAVPQVLDGHSSGLGAGAHYGQIEYAYHLMAVEAGITMSRCELLAEGPRRHFITRRFDRDTGGAKRHMVSLCGLDHLDFNMVGVHSYDQYLGAVERLGLGPDAVVEAYRRMVFNVAAANCDDHTKNFAFLRRDGGDWELAPAFDVTFAHDPNSHWTRQHLLAVNGKVAGIGLADLWAVAARHDVSGYRAVTRKVLAAVDRWREFAATAGLAETHTDHIARVLEQHRPT